MSKYDVIVIGGGHNGLTTATILAKSGKKVLVVEKRKILGGIAAGEEFHPGYFTTGLLHDTSGVRADVIKSLQLEKHGLKLENKRSDVVLLSKDGRSVTIKADADATAGELRKISEQDAEAYKAYQEFSRKISKVINDLMDNPPPNVDVENLTMASLVVLAKKGMLLKGLGNKTMMELLKVAPMCVADFLNEKFKTDFVKAGIASPALYGSYAGPWSAYSTINLLLWECASRSCVKGGPQALISALQKAATQAGVEIRTGAEVEKIVLDEAGAARGVRLKGGEEISAMKVAASCTPKETFLNLFDTFELEYELDYWIEKIRSRGTTAKVNLAVNKKVELNGQAVEFARTGNSLDEMEKAFDPVKYKEVTNSPFLDIHIPTVSNPALAPEGHSVVSVLVHQIPYDFKGGWTVETKKKLGEDVLKTLEIYSSGLSQAVAGMEVLSPADLEDRYTLTHGHIYHGEHFVDQLITRPVPSCAHYTTPVSGLYLCGSGSHPGGGITCAPGSMAAAAILKSS
ncbi:MAG: NAD(P)/FAD-dependent oxidoreductase [Flammeovirgaceae bacterium]|nr:NAD(P)/FAD-dependent oxidoreductase [Flammeovirgaceae bacterium]